MDNESYSSLLRTYQQMGGSESILQNENIAHLVIHENEIFSSRLVEGFLLDFEKKEDGVDIDFRVKKDHRIKHPVHLCFGVVPRKGIQKIKIKGKIEENAEIKMLAHCMFPNAENVVHEMDADIDIGNNSSYEYLEQHYHGEKGGVKVVPKANLRVGDSSKLYTTFSLLHGRVGELNIDYDVEVGENGVMDVLAKVLGYSSDNIKIKERGHLNGRCSRGLLKSRVVVKDKARSEVISELYAGAEAEGARGHVDCVELVMNGAHAKAIPVVDVLNEKAKVTHEASIGTVDKKQLNTLMAKGLSPEEATDVIVKGYLK